MKKFLFVISFLLSFGSLFAQLSGTPGTNPRTTSSAPPPEDYNLSVRANFLVPRFTDTTQANNNVRLDTCGKIIYTYDVLSLWVRQCSPKRWVQIGGNVEIQDSPTIDFSGNGSASSPLTASLIVSQAAGNSAQVRADGFYVPTFISNGIVEGGDITNVPGSYTYDVTETDYVIAGVPYTAPETQVTLQNADPLLNRIDRIVVTTSNTIEVITGTPADDPQEPSYDPLTQYPLAIVLVTANTTAPNVNSEYIYLNNAEWTTASSNGTRINPASAVNPFSAPLDVDYTLTQNGDNIRYTDPSPPTVLFPTYKVLTMKVFSKATWASTSRVIMRFYSGASPVGIDVVLADGIFQFNSSNTSDYQTITINLSNFGQVSSVTSILFTTATTGGNTIGLHIDNIQLQGGDGAITPVIGSFWQQGGNRWGTTGVLGTLDNFNLQLIANGANHTMLQTGGTTWMQGTNPGISFFLGTFAASDYFIRRVANTVTLNVASGAIIDHTISGNSMYNISSANGHIFNSSAGAFQAQINSSGQLLVGTNSQTASNLAAFNSTTRAVRLTNQTNTQMNAIANDAGMITYNTTVGSLYYNNGAGWFPIGGAITADNGLTMSSASNVRWGGDLTTATTTITGGVGENIRFVGATTVGTFFRVDNTAGTNTFAIEGIALNSVGVFGQDNGSGIGVTGYSSAGTGVQAYSDTGLPLDATALDAATSSITDIVVLTHETSGSALAGFGSSIEYRNETSSGVARLSNQLIAKWTDVTDGTRHSQFQITGINSSVTTTLATFDGSGSVGIGSTTPASTASRLYIRDVTSATGNVFELDAASVDVAAQFTNTGGTAIHGTAGSNGAGVRGTNDGASGSGMIAQGGFQGLQTSVSSANGTSLSIPLNVINNVNPSGGSVIMAMYSLAQNAGTDNNQMHFRYNFINDNNQGFIGHEIYVTSTDVSDNVEDAMVEWRLINNGSTGNVLRMESDGTLHLLGSPYVGLGAGILAVSNTGEISWAAAGGGGGDVVKVGTPVNDQLGVWTGNGTIEGDPDLTFTGSSLRIGLAGSTTGQLLLDGATSGTITIQGASAAGTYTLTLPTTDGNSGEYLQTNGSGVLTWASPAGAGTVTSIGLTSTDITVGGSASPITSSGTWTLTLATVNGNVGTFGSSTAIPVFTVNGKGLITAVSTNPVIAPAGTLTGTTLAANVVNSSLTSHGTITSGGLGTGAVIGDVTMNLAGADSQGDTYYRAASGVLTRLPIGLAGQALIVSGGGLPVWTTLGSGGTVTSVAATSTSLTITGSPITTSGTFVINLNGNALGLQSLATTGFVVRSGANTFVTVTQINAATQVTGVLAVANGGTGISSITSSRVLVTNASGYVQVLPTFGNGITVTVGAGTLDIRGVFNPTPQTLTDAATVVWNVTNGGNAFLNLTGTNRTLSITNPVAGYTYTIRIQQGSANRIISTWPTGTRWAGGTPPTLSTTAGAIDVISLYYDGSNYYGTFGLSFSFIDIPTLKRNIVPLYEETFNVAA